MARRNTHNWKWLLVPAVMMVLGWSSGCRETAITVVFHPQLKIPDRLDAFCMTLVTDDRYQMSFHNLLAERETGGGPRTISVVADDHLTFDLRLRGDLRGWPISWLRHSFNFNANEILSVSLDFPAVPESWQGTFKLQPLNFSKPTAAVGVPTIKSPARVLLFQENTVSQIDPLVASPTQVKLFTSSVQGPTIAISTADLNNDCLQDVVVLNDGAVHFYLQDQTGTFRQGQVLVGAGFRGMALARFNEDEFLDLVLATTDQLKIFLGNEGGSFVEKSGLVPDPLPGITGVALGLINNDLQPDIVLARNGYPNVVLYPSAEGITQSPLEDTLQVNHHSTGVLVAELWQPVAAIDSRDAHKEFHEIVFSNEGNPLTYYHNRDGQLIKVETPPFNDAIEVRQLLAHDLDDNGFNDLIIVEPGRTRILYFAASGQFTVIPLEATLGFVASQGQVVDVDGDYRWDLLLAGDSGVQWWKNQ